MVSGLQWSWTVREGQAINVCTGQDVVIAWSFSLAPGETTDLIEWRYRSVSEWMSGLMMVGWLLNVPAASLSHLVNEAVDEWVSKWLLACLFNVPATCECISGTDLLEQLYVLPH